MSQAMAKARRTSSGFRQYLLAAYFLIVGNVSITTMIAGALLVLVGWQVVTEFHQVLGPMFAVWGVTLIILGAVAYALLWVNKIIARLSE